MLTIADLKHGDQIWVSDKTLMSALIKNAQGDFEWSHVCSFWIIDGKPTILTTGASFDWKQMGFIYGAVDAEEYLSTRKWIAQRRTDLNDEQQQIRLECLQSFRYRKVTYAIAKLLKLASWRFKAGVADKLSKEPATHPNIIFNPDKVFCSESEALGIIEAKALYYMRKCGGTFAEAYTQALLEVNSKYPEKKEACVHTPETLFDAPESAVITPSSPGVKASSSFSNL